MGREFARAGWPLLVVCLRLGRLWSADDDGAPDARSLSLEDALQALRLGLAFRPSDAGRGAGGGETSRRAGRGAGPDGWVVPRTAGWHVFHIPGGRRARFPLAGAAHPSFGYAPRHDFGGYGAPPEPRPARVDAQGRLTPVGEASRTAPAPRAGTPTVTVFGACGPLAAAAAPLLAPSYTLRLTDVLSPEDGAARIAERWPEAPRPARPGPPHAFRLVDITDPLAVQDAAEGADTLLNCTVVREQAPGAFRVNTLGAYNVLRAALGQGIRRVVHTGPQILSPDHPAGYSVDFDVPDEVPVRAGANVYFLSKYLALEICRTFAENHGLEVAALLFSTFVNPEQPGPMRGAPGPATVSWGDAGLALRRALEVPALPSPFEAMRILGDLPGAKYSNQKARRILGWAPRDSLSAPLANRALSSTQTPQNVMEPSGCPLMLALVHSGAAKRCPPTSAGSTTPSRPASIARKSSRWGPSRSRPWWVPSRTSGRVELVRGDGEADEGAGQPGQAVRAAQLGRQGPRRGHGVEPAEVPEGGAVVLVRLARLGAVEPAHARAVGRRQQHEDGRHLHHDHGAGQGVDDGAGRAGGW